MVEYVLKIDIDESELVRKLNAAFSKAKLVVGGGSVSGGGGGSASGDTSQSGFRSTTIKLGKSQIDLRNKYQKTFDAFAKKTQDYHGKTMSSGTVVKLAGLAVGVAGLMQMRKMIIDASPMLQAMLKLLNVGIMFILRPIGDFIGFVLRPLLIPFLKIAVQWYQKNLGFVIDKGGQVGTSFAEGEYLEGIKGIYNFLTGLALGPDSDAFKEYEERQAAHDKFWADAGLAWDKFWGGTKIPVMQFSGLGPRETIDLDGEEFKSARDKPTPIPGMYNVGDTVAKEDIDSKHYQIKLTEEIAISDKNIETSVVKSNTSLTQMENYMAIEVMLNELAVAEAARQTAIMEAGFSALAIDLPAGMQQTAEVLELLQSNATKKMFPGGGIGDADQVALLQQGHDAQVSYLEELYNLDDGTDRAAKKIRIWEERVSVSKDMLDQHTNALRYNIDELRAISESNARAALAGGLAFSQTGGGGGGSGCPYGGPCRSSGQYTTPTGAPSFTPPTTLTSSGSSPSGNIARCGREYGTGGMIEEEIFGVGKCSGKRYRFGESGDEVVIPYHEFMKSQSLGQLTGTVGGGGRGSRNVGKFSGISGSRYGRYTQNIFNAQQAVSGTQGEIDELGEFQGTKQYRSGTTTYKDPHTKRNWHWAIMSNTPEYQAFLDVMNPLQKQLATGMSSLDAAEAKMQPYSNFFTGEQSISALSGQKQFESSSINTAGGSTTSLGGVTINVSGAQNADQIIAEIGPKLLQYLQDNDRRIGIR